MTIATSSFLCLQAPTSLSPLPASASHAPLRLCTLGLALPLRLLLLPLRLSPLPPRFPAIHACCPPTPLRRAASPHVNAAYAAAFSLSSVLFCYPLLLSLYLVLPAHDRDTQAQSTIPHFYINPTSVPRHPPPRPCIGSYTISSRPDVSLQNGVASYLRINASTRTYAWRASIGRYEDKGRA